MKKGFEQVQENKSGKVDWIDHEIELDTVDKYHGEVEVVGNIEDTLNKLDEILTTNKRVFKGALTEGEKVVRSFEGGRFIDDCEDFTYETVVEFNDVTEDKKEVIDKVERSFKTMIKSPLGMHLINRENTVKHLVAKMTYANFELYIEVNGERKGLTIYKVTYRGTEWQEIKRMYVKDKYVNKDNLFSNIRVRNGKIIYDMRIGLIG